MNICFVFFFVIDLLFLILNIIKWFVLVRVILIMLFWGVYFIVLMMRLLKVWCNSFLFFWKYKFFNLVNKIKFFLFVWNCLCLIIFFIKVFKWILLLKVRWEVLFNLDKSSNFLVSLFIWLVILNILLIYSCFFFLFCVNLSCVSNCCKCVSGVLILWDIFWIKCCFIWFICFKFWCIVLKCDCSVLILLWCVCLIGVLKLFFIIWVVVFFNVVIGLIIEYVDVMISEIEIISKSVINIVKKILNLLKVFLIFGCIKIVNVLLFVLNWIFIVLFVLLLKNFVIKNV